MKILIYAVILILCAAFFALGIAFSGYRIRPFLEHSELKNQKNKQLSTMAMSLLDYQLSDLTLEKVLVSRDYHKIAIYGMGELGQIICKILRDSTVSVEYGIDRRADSIVADVLIYQPDEIVDNVDAIIVTVVGEFDHIKDALGSKVKCPIVSLETLL